MARRAQLVVLAVLLAGFSPTPAVASVGGLDPTFGANGIAYAGQDLVKAQAAPLLRSDGKVVTASLRSGAVTLTRFTATGTPELSSPTGIAAPGDRAATALASGDRVVVAGGSSSGGTITVGRFVDSGAVDPKWNGGQLTVAKLSASNPTMPTSALVQGDGSLLVTVLGDVGSRYGFTVVRFTADGRLDTSWGSSKGYSQAIVAKKDAAAFDVAVLSNGSVLLAGGILDPTRTVPVDTALVRLDASGKLDGSFGSGGVKTLDLGSGANDGAYGVVACGCPDATAGSFLIAGPAGDGGMVARFTPTGDLDARFDDGAGLAGVVRDTGLAPDGRKLVPTDVAVDGSMRVLVAGTVAATGTAPATWGFARLGAGGGKDIAQAYQDCAGAGARVSGLRPAPKDRVLLAGDCGDPARSAVARVWAGAPIEPALSLGVSPLSERAGHERVDLARLSPGAVLTASETLQATPFRASPFRASPFRASPFRASPFRASPFRASPFRASPFRASPFRASPLSEVPLNGRSWSDVLAGTAFADRPLQNITLGEVLDANPPALEGLTLADIDLGATPLRSLSLASLLLYPVPVGRFRTPAGGWPAGTDPARTTFLDLELAGNDLSAYYADPINVKGVDLTGDNAGDDGRAILAKLPLKGLELAETPYKDVPVSAAAALFPGCSSGTIAECQAATNYAGSGDHTLGELLGTAAGPATISLGDVLLGIVAPQEIPFERTPLARLIAAADIRTTELQTYSIGYTVDCTDGDHKQYADVTLPGDARYASGGVRVDLSNGRSKPAFELCGPTPDIPQTGTLTFAVEPGSDLGAGTATVVLRGSAKPVKDQAVTVVDNDRDGQALRDGELVTGHLSGPSDVDTFKITAPPAGARMTVTLAHLPADYDLFLEGAATDAPSASPFRASPFRASPFRASPVPDSTEEPTDPTVVGPNAVQDTPYQSTEVRAQSIRRGSADEAVSVISRSSDAGKTFTVRIAGFDDANSQQPYVLRYAETPAPKAPPCGSRSIGTLGTRGALPTPADDTRTLVLVDQERMGALYGDAATTAMLADLRARYLGRPEVKGVVVPVDGDLGVRNAYAAWDANPCVVARANDVVRAINGVVAGLRSGGKLPQLRNVVLLGPDVALPQMRVADESRLANENSFADDMVFGGTDDPVSRALREGYLLTDDAYGSFDPQSLGTRLLYIPDVAVGRLVETPADITAAVGAYVANDGVIRPRDGFVAGYDFLKDAAARIQDGLSPLFPGGLTTQINDTWTAQQGIGGINRPASGLSSVNAHFDTYRALAADGRGVFGATDAQPNPQSVLFTIGCHSGLNVAAAGFASGTTDPAFTDWTQQVARTGALWVGQTGFGLGDSEAVAYSERLMSGFAENIGAGRSNLGQSLMYAKQQYAATSLGLLDDYDVKALQEATFYGLPTYVTQGGETAAPSPPAAPSDASAQYDSATYEFDASRTPFVEHPTDRGRYWTVGDEEPLVIQHRPVQPRTTLDVTPADGKPVHGALVDALTTTEIGGVNPVIARPTIDLDAIEPEPVVSTVAFPASLAAVSPLATPAGRREQLTLFPGQFQSTSATSGTQRLATRMRVRVLRSASPDYDPPPIDEVDSVVANGTVAFSVVTGADDAVGGVVLYRTGATWNAVNLARAGARRLAATAAVASGDPIPYIVQVVDGPGNVSISTNKAVDWSAQPAPVPPAGDPRLTVNGATQPAAFYGGPVTVDVADRSAGATYELQIDGGDWTAYTGPVVVGGEGPHVVRLRGSDRKEASIGFIVDTQAPTITAAPRTAPSASGWWAKSLTVDFFCADAGSGIADCSPPVTLTTEGANTVTGTATDRAGRSTTQTFGPYKVDATDPTVQISAESGGVTLVADGTLTGSAADTPSGVDEVTVTYTEDVATAPRRVTERYACGGAASCLWSVPRPPSGTWKAVATVTDRAGNRATAGPVTVGSYDPVPCDPGVLGLVANGNFECPQIPDGKFATFSKIPGWTQSSPNPDNPSFGIELQRRCCGEPSLGAGGQFVELASNGPTRISQTLATAARRNYVLTFIWSARPGTSAEDNRFQVKVGDVTKDFGPLAGSSATDWQSVSIPFTASSSSTPLSFTDTGSPADAHAAYVDRVKVEVAAK